MLHPYIEQYNNANSKDEKYKAFMALRSNLPSGFEMWMTVQTNYLQLKTIFIQRHNHKLKEDWVDSFCTWAKTLPLFNDLCLSNFINNGGNKQ